MRLQIGVLPPGDTSMPLKSKERVRSNFRYRATISEDEGEKQARTLSRAAVANSGGRGLPPKPI